MVAICAVTVFTITSVSNRSDSMENLFNANVEALADTEGKLRRMCVPNATAGDSSKVYSEAINSRCNRYETYSLLLRCCSATQRLWA